MDFYTDFTRTMEETDTPAATLEHLKALVLGAIQTAPARVALVEAVSLLAVLYDCKSPGAVQLMPTFNEIKMEVELLLSALAMEVGVWDDLQAKRVFANAESDLPEYHIPAED